MVSNRLGPLLPWQEYMSQIPSSLKPMVRLYRSGQYGLPVGTNSRHLGGIKIDVVHRLLLNGVVYVSTNDKDEIVRVYPCQYAFNFLNHSYWQTWSMHQTGYYRDQSYENLYY